MELSSLAFREGNDKYNEKQVTIESNFLSTKEQKLLEGLALVMGAYNLSPDVIARVVKDCVEQLRDSMLNNPGYWESVYTAETLEGRINYYKELTSELALLGAMLK